MTPAGSPWSNGIVERHNRTLTEILHKVNSDDPDMDLETAIVRSVNTKNILTNVHGFSSHQLVYGVNLHLPTSLNDNLQASVEGSWGDHWTGWCCGVSETW